MEKNLVIKFFAGVNQQSSTALMGAIDDAINSGVENLTLLISTPGGSVFHGLSIYNYLKGLPLKTLRTHNFGSVDSIGVVIYCAGTSRTSSPQARFLVHGVTWSWNAPTTLEEPQLEETLKSLRIDMENISKVIGVNTGKEEGKVFKAMIDRTTLNPEQAKEWGLVQEIKTELFPEGTRVISIQS
jgi:ATP-dependent protease ClpP protease subunit